jgi:hypothetical protein
MPSRAIVPGGWIFPLFLRASEIPPIIPRSCASAFWQQERIVRGRCTGTIAHEVSCFCWQTACVTTCLISLLPRSCHRQGLLLLQAARKGGLDVREAASISCRGERSNWLQRQKSGEVPRLLRQSLQTEEEASTQMVKQVCSQGVVGVLV